MGKGDIGMKEKIVYVNGKAIILKTMLQTVTEVCVINGKDLRNCYKTKNKAGRQYKCREKGRRKWKGHSKKYWLSMRI